MSLAFIDALDDAVGCNLSHDLLYMFEGMTMLLGRKIELTSLQYRLHSRHFFCIIISRKVYSTTQRLDSVFMSSTSIIVLSSLATVLAVIHSEF